MQLVKALVFSAVISLVALVNYLKKKDLPSKKKLILTFAISLFLIIYEFFWSIFT
ncbi:hypothetical protein [Lactobacillus mulieris]|uniref:Bacteriocin immunity protein n=1 Tax=Lactobacillus mulieris TaxID=2508708 RepID=A0AAW5WYD5_9LACO|nr:hypothetical protein [Lactobacillus mulieris]MCZ3622073.1 hypothetical protein [Lactobacillus mulieris]MCZ3623770.1 hypothetical protein [Lactobacillus mulieris]MCZ3636080.1 hypothetical protein [Lactobacillus mulieris]MCZ3689989.1 hypothetical protein [Lactobacillus mulieris]MCZ3696168.1 hypothetical protein [Lactobacillus mulieris]